MKIIAKEVFKTIFNKALRRYHKENVATKQDALRSGENIKTINGDSILGEGNLAVGGGELTAELDVTNNIGKYSQGDVIPKDTPFETIFRGILSKTYYPALIAPAASIADSYPTLAEVGVSIAAASVRVNFSRGSINPQYTAESPYRAGAATGYALALTGASVQYSDSNDNGQFAVPVFTRNSKGNVVLSATVNYAAGVQPKDSDGNNYQSPLPAGSVAATKTIEFILPFYYGASDSPTITDFTGLTKDLKKKGDKAYKFTTNNQHMVIAYDASYGNLKSIIDPNGFEVISGWIVSEVVVNGQTYKVYVAEYATTASNNTFTFKF